jgi:hypothetical protein
MCTVLLPPGVNPIAVNEYISYHITSYIISYESNINVEIGREKNDTLPQAAAGRATHWHGLKGCTVTYGRSSFMMAADPAKMLLY